MRRPSRRKPAAEIPSPVEFPSCPGTEKAADRWTPTTQNPVDLATVRTQITNRIGNAAMQMVEATIEQVNQGHYQPLKMLLEMIGLAPVPVPEEMVEEDSLAKTLLSRLGLVDEENTSSQPKTLEPAADAVE